MSERGIIFSAAMVRALLDGRKTMTRRVLKPQPPEGARYTGVHFASYEAPSWFFGGRLPWKTPERFAEGDVLWVREGFTRSDHPARYCVAYRADGECGAWAWDGDGKPMFIRHGHVVEASPAGIFGYSRYGGRWRSPIHMPRWASRLTLTVTEVRVGRLQEVSEEDALAEGIETLRFPDRGDWGWPRDRFRTLWNSIHGAGAWDANPWVVAIRFTVERRNIDVPPESPEGGKP